MKRARAKAAGSIDLADPDDPRMPHGDLSPDLEPPRAGGLDLELRLAAGRDGIDLRVHGHVPGRGLERNLCRFALGSRGRDQDVDDIVVDHDRAEPTRAAAGALGTLEEAVVDDHVAGDLLDAGGVDFAGQVVEPGERVGRHDIAAEIPPRVGVVVILEEELAVGAGSSAHAQVATGDEDQVAAQGPRGVDVPAADDRRLEPVVRPEFDQGRSHAEELGHRRRGEESVGMLLEYRGTRLPVNHEEPPVAVAEARRLEDGLDLSVELRVRGRGCREFLTPRGPQQTESGQREGEQDPPPPSSRVFPQALANARFPRHHAKVSLPV